MHSHQVDRFRHDQIRYSNINLSNFNVEDVEDAKTQSDLYEICEQTEKIAHFSRQTS